MAHKSNLPVESTFEIPLKVKGHLCPRINRSSQAYPVELVSMKTTNEEEGDKQPLILNEITIISG